MLIETFRERWNKRRPLLDKLEAIPESEFSADDGQDYEATMGELSTLQSDINAAIDKRNQDATPTQAKRDAQYKGVVALSHLQKWPATSLPARTLTISSCDAGEGSR